MLSVWAAVALTEAFLNKVKALFFAPRDIFNAILRTPGSPGHSKTIHRMWVSLCPDPAPHCA